MKNNFGHFFSSLETENALGKARGFLLIRQFVRRIKDSKSKIVSGQNLKKAANLWPYLENFFGLKKMSDIFCLTLDHENLGFPLKNRP